MLCPNCNTENRDGANFCKSCGGTLPAEQAPVESVVEQEVEQVVEQTVEQTPPEQAPVEPMIEQAPSVQETEQEVVQTTANAVKIPKAAIIMSVVAVAVIVACVSLNSVAKSLTDPNKVSADYTDAVMNGDWDKAVSFLILKKTGMTDEEHFIEFAKNNPQTVTQKQNINLVKTGEKKFLFYDVYKIEVSDMIVSGVSIRVPKGAKAYIDGTALVPAAEDGVYDVPDVFAGNHTFRVEHPDCESVTENVDLSDGISEYKIDYLTLTASAASNLTETTRSAYFKLIASAKTDNGFDGPEQTRAYYNYLCSAFAKNSDGSGFKDIEITNVADLSDGVIDRNGTCRCTLRIDYNYTVSSLVWSGKINLTSSLQDSYYSGSTTVRFDYVFASGRWVLADAYMDDLGIDTSAAQTPSPASQISKDTALEELSYYLSQHYKMYLIACNQQDTGFLAYVTDDVKKYLTERIFGINKDDYFEYDKIVIDLDTVQLYEQNGKVNVKFTALFAFKYKKRSGVGGWTDGQLIQDVNMVCSDYVTSEGVPYDIWDINSLKIVKTTIGSNQKILY